jgi:hypothetical protein
MPPLMPAKTIVRPSGDQVGVVISETPSIFTSSSTFARSTSISTSTSLPALSALKAKRRLSGAHVPAELM